MNTHAITDQLTRDYLDSWMIRPSYIGSTAADISAEYFGETYRSPVMISTLSGMTRVNPGGNVLLAKEFRTGIQLFINQTVICFCGLIIFFLAAVVCGKADFIDCSSCLCGDLIQDIRDG